MNKSSLHNKGFSLIEILVSVAIFAVVVISGTVAILSIIDANQKSQSLNSVMTNLNTTLETMAREVRVGTNYIITNNGQTLNFMPGSGCSDNCLTYTLQGQSIARNNTVTDGANNFIPVTANEVHITGMSFSQLHPDTDVASGGSGNSLLNDKHFQPGIILKIEGYAQTRTQTKSAFFLQTLMSQRLVE